MSWEYLGTVLALIGIGLAPIFALPPPWWPEMPPVLVTGGLLVGLALVIAGAICVATGVRDFPATFIPILVMAFGSYSFVIGLLAMTIRFTWFLG